MLEKFTDLSIQNLAPASKRYDKREEGGFVVRVFPSGEKSFQFVYTFGGRRRRMTLGIYHPKAFPLKKARAEYHIAKGELARGIDPGAKKLETKQAERRAWEEERQQAGIEKLVEEYLEHYAKPRKRSWKEDERILRVDVIPAWKGRKVADITRRDVTQLLDGIKARVLKLGRSNGHQTNKVLVILRKMFNVGIDRGMVEANPCLGMSRPVRDRARDRVLSDDEIRVIWDGLRTAPFSADAADVLRLMFCTGQRKGEILQMEWKHISEDGTWYLPAEICKNGRAHSVPLPRMALEIIERRRAVRISDRYVFAAATAVDADPDKQRPILGTTVDHGVRRWADPEVAKERVLQMPHWTPHDARRTVETKLAALGVSETVRKKLLNHVRDKITETYDRHSYNDEKREALNLLEIDLRRILGENVAALRRKGRP